MKILKPELALLDETDSGLDVDALKVVAEGVNSMRTQTSAAGRRPAPKGKEEHSHTFSALIVTHYARILEYITPDHVHVMVAGNIVESGGPEFARELEKSGYAKYGEAPKSAAFRLELG